MTLLFWPQVLLDILFFGLLSWQSSHKLQILDYLLQLFDFFLANSIFTPIFKILVRTLLGIHRLDKMWQITSLLQGFTSRWMFGGPWDSTLNMMGVPSLKLGVPSFYISFEFWKVVHPSLKAQCNCVVPRSVILRAMFGPLPIFLGGHLKFLRATYYHQWNTILYTFFYKSWTCRYNMQDQASP